MLLPGLGRPPWILVVFCQLVLSARRVLFTFILPRLRMRRFAAAKALVVGLFLGPETLGARFPCPGVAARFPFRPRVRMIIITLVVRRAAIVLLDHILTSRAVYIPAKHENVPNLTIGYSSVPSIPHSIE